MIMWAILSHFDLGYLFLRKQFWLARILYFKTQPGLGAKIASLERRASSWEPNPQPFNSKKGSFRGVKGLLM